jgi:hypothetical protein
MDEMDRKDHVRAERILRVGTVVEDARGEDKLEQVLEGLHGWDEFLARDRRRCSRSRQLL